MNYSFDKIGIKIKQISSFPSFLSHHFMLGKEDSTKFSYGVVLNYSSTGARSNYNDYSGGILLDYLVCSYDFGLFGEHQTPLDQSFSIILGSRLLYSTSFFQINTKYNLLDENSITKIKVESSSIQINPYFAISYQIKHFLILFRSGFLLDFSGNLHNPNNSDLYLIDSRNSKITTNWTGARIGVSIRFRF